MKQTSGFDALIEALKQSGVNVDGRFDADHEAPSGGAGRAGGGGGGAQPPHVNVEIPFADRMASWGKRALIVAAIVIILVGLGAYWWFHPPINIHSTDTWMFVAVFILLPLFLLFWSRSYSYKNGTSKVEPNAGKAKAFKWASYLPVLVAVIGVIGAVASLSIFPGNAAKYANVLQTETETDVYKRQRLFYPTQNECQAFSTRHANTVTPSYAASPLASAVASASFAVCSAAFSLVPAFELSRISSTGFVGSASTYVNEMVSPSLYPTISMRPGSAKS